MAKDKAKKPSVFDDSDDDTGGGVELKVNEEYAKRFEHNKKREEKHRLEEKQKAGKTNGTHDDDDSDDSSSDDETEDEDGFLATAELDAQLNATLEAIRKKDPRVYDSSVTFYSPIEEAQAAADAAAAAAKQKKEKPVTIQDYHRKRYLEGDTGKDFDDDDEAAPQKSYVQEQADIKQSIRDEIAKFNEDVSEDDGDDFIKAKSKPERQVTEVESATATTDIHPSRAGRVKTPAVPKPDVTLADKDPELFLSNFMASRAWVEDEGPKWEAFESDDGDDAGDDKADAWEEAYNLRFEDPSKSNEVLKTYARDVTAARSVRREEKSSRKRQREQEAEKKALEKQQRKEERARLRRLKIEEAENKLNKIRKAAGLSGNALRDEDWQKLLDAGFDNDKWEEEMAKHFNEQYYAQADEEMGAAQSDAESEDNEDDEGEEKKKGKSKKPKKPTWDDDIDIKDLVPDFDDETAAAPVGAGNDEEEDDDDNEEDGPSAKRQKTTKDRKKERLQSQKEARKERAKLEAIVDAHMNIEDPEILANGGGGSGAASTSAEPKQTGFRYRETKPESFGLTTLDILMASDSALNQYAGLKKLAHFRPEDKQAKDKKRLGKKARLRQWRKETFGEEFEREPPAFNPGRPDPVEETATAGKKGEAGELNIIEGGSKKKRTRSKGKKNAEATA
ncbi:KRI1-like family C-terminal-domain-containing protein [Microdochium trichocladiopsis]|uniref:KRI1-like family C-terminal-domain-containing protein n=1 Tax=Microdochium trichocladiopsis TaxID=1682393 RepID=A0A9P8YJH3_9PEZI|nr:KRI1-like family C-terminal-domain-containing protein [Microdochium trichocladiopsis]KAH7041092.1 KRI1-like family C-terminal-domain-containing protein [Microdochium trichocladiopsis]